MKTTFSRTFSTTIMILFLALILVGTSFQALVEDAIYFVYDNISLHVTLFIHFTLFSLFPMSISLFSMCFPLLP